MAATLNPLPKPEQEEGVMKTLSICAFWHWRAFRYLVLPLALVVSGSLTANTAAAATTLGENEGVIIGSVMINVASPAENSSFGRGGRKLAKAKWSLEIVKTKGFSFGHHIRVKTGVETHFLKKLGAGSYRLEKLAGQGTLSMFGVPLGMEFTVTPQVSTYLGRIEVTVPYRHREGPVSVRLVDGQNETIQALEKEYSEYVKVVTKSLLITSVPATAPGESSFQDMLSMTASRKDINDYKEFRTQFVNYARSRDTENLLVMMAPYNYAKAKLIIFFEKEIFPFFADFKEITGNVVNIVKDEFGDPGYTLYEFIKTTKGEEKPYAIAIVEKNKGFAVKNIIVNKCFREFHGNC